MFPSFLAFFFPSLLIAFSLFPRRKAVGGAEEAMENTRKLLLCSLALQQAVDEDPAMDPRA
jgi:hypothetical protein